MNLSLGFLSLIHRYYIDEQLLIRIVLRAPHRQPTQVQELIKRLSISLELRANDSSSGSSTALDDEKQRKTDRQDDVIWKGNIDATESPTLITGRGGESGVAAKDMLVVWTCEAVLSKRLS